MTFTDKEQFIQAHMAVCHKTGRKRYKKQEGTPHKGLGAYRVRNEHTRRRSCARHLWNTCERNGIAPVLHWADMPEGYKR